MLHLKVGVSIERLTPRMAIGCRIIEGAYESMGIVCVITSGDDGDHMEGSKHYVGDALDFRISNVPEGRLPALVARIKLALGESNKQFDVVLELAKRHIHAEYDAKP